MSTNIANLFKTAGDEFLSQQSLNALEVIDLGAQIQAAMGTQADQIQASEVVLITIIIDDSGSIDSAGNRHIVIDGHNTIIEALRASKQKDGIIAHCVYLNGHILYPYVPIEQAVLMNTSNYDPNKGTPLYERSLATLAAVIAKHQEFAANGVPARTVTLIVTDGADLHSVKATAASVATVVKDMAAAENHIIAAMGIDDGGHTDFKKIFKEMGIDDKWILTPRNSQSEIRKAFLMFSQSAVRASQSGKSFSQTAMGGFGNP